MNNNISLLLKTCFVLILLFSTQANAFAWVNTLENKQKSKNVSMSAIEMAITHNQQGNTYLEQGYPLHAIDEFKIGIMLNPNSTMSGTLYNNLGRAYEKIQAYDHAIASYEHAIRINPNFAIYYKNLVNAYINKKQLGKAQTNYEKIVKVNPEDAQAYFILAIIYLEQEDKPKAKEALNTFLKLQPHIDLALAAKKYLKRLEK